MVDVKIRVGHSADPDDAFMFWAIEAGRVDARGLELEQVVSDIQTLNEWALEGRLEVTALSMGAYPEVADRYVLLPHGASMGFGYGPVVVAREPLGLDELRDREIVIPGRLTTAYLTLRLALGQEIAVRELPFDEILDEVSSGRAEAGLLIHEGQLTYAASGLHKAARPRRLVAGGDRAAAPARRQRRTARPRRAASGRLGGPLRGDPLRPRPSHGGARVRRAVRPRDRPRDGGPVRRHVRQRAHLRLRRARA